MHSGYLSLDWFPTVLEFNGRNVKQQSLTLGRGFHTRGAGAGPELHLLDRLYKRSDVARSRSTWYHTITICCRRILKIYVGIVF